jgi:hypothetical protein
MRIRAFHICTSAAFAAASEVGGSRSLSSASISRKDLIGRRRVSSSGLSMLGTIALFFRSAFANVLLHLARVRPCGVFKRPAWPFPRPWSVDDPDTKLGQDCFIVRDGNGQALDQRLEGAGIAPICWSNPKRSLLSHSSAILPLTTRKIAIAVTFTCLPVGLMP